ncbi:MAG: DUF2321 domain-containing protein [Anaerolineaceae bacterium]|nr:DUF2321 domain-containing protein [Anaerolineaceae bacterium]
MLTEYYARQTCVNGHIISNMLESANEASAKFCSKCGAETIINCPACNTPQHGAIEGVVSMGSKVPDAFCHSCGKPYPWTNKQLEATSELVKEDEQLSDEDKATLTKSLPDLMADTPSTALAATRFKRIVGKAGPVFKAAMYKFIVDVSSSAAKKIVCGE